MPRGSEGQAGGTEFQREAREGPQAQKPGFHVLTRRASCTHWAREHAEGASVVALGSPHALDDHPVCRGEAQVVAVLHVRHRRPGPGCRLQREGGCSYRACPLCPVPTSPLPPPPTSLQESTQEASRGQQLMERAGGQGPGRRHPGRMS